MGGLVVGSAFPSFVGEGEVGGPGSEPTVGGLSRYFVDYTRLDPQTTFRRSLRAWLPLMDEGLRQREISTFAPADVEGRVEMAWTIENLTILPGRRGQVRCSRTNHISNTLSLGNDVASARSDEGTVAMWLKVVDIDPLADGLLVRLGKVSDGILLGVSTVGTISILFTDGGLPVNWVATTAAVVADGQWHHVAWRSDGSTWTIWIDGTSVALTTIFGSNVGNWVKDVSVDPAEVAIIDQNAFSSAYTVELSDFGLWDRPLADAEIRQLWFQPDSVYASTLRTVVLDRYRLHPTGIAGQSALGTPRVNMQIQPSAIASGQAFGTAKLNQQIRPMAIGSASAFGTAKVNQQVRPVAIAGVSAFGTAKVNQQIRPVALASASAFGTPTAITAQFIQPTGIASASAFGTARLNQQIIAAAIASGQAFGLARLNQQIRPVALASVSALGTPTLAQQIRPVGIVSSEAFGLARLNQQILCTGIASAELFGTATVSLAGANQIITAVAIPSAQAFGTARLNQQIRPSGAASAEAFGTARLNQQIQPDGISSLSAFGLARLNQQIRALGLASSEAFGTAALGQQIRPSGVTSAEAFGTARLNQQIRALGIVSVSALGVGFVFHGLAVPMPKKGFVIELASSEAEIDVATAAHIVTLLGTGATVALVSPAGVVTLVPASVVLTLPSRATDISL